MAKTVELLPNLGNLKKVPEVGHSNGLGVTSPSFIIQKLNLELFWQESLVFFENFQKYTCQAVEVAIENDAKFCMDDLAAAWNRTQDYLLALIENINAGNYFIFEYYLVIFSEHNDISFSSNGALDYYSNRTGLFLYRGISYTLIVIH